MLDPIREAMVREDHQPDGPCGRCRRPRMGPCDVTILLAEVDRLRAQVAAIEEYAEKRQWWPRFAPFADEILALVGWKPRD